MNGGEVDLRGTNYLVCKTPGTLVIDNKSLYAKLQRPYHGQSKKIDIELLALKEADHQNGLDLRWVSAQAQLANSLTKRGEDHQMNRFVACHQTWRIVDDPDMFSGRRLKQQGRDLLDLERKVPDVEQLPSLKNL
jgi:hypothetical protein